MEKIVYLPGGVKGTLLSTFYDSWQAKHVVRIEVEVPTDFGPGLNSGTQLLIVDDIREYPPVVDETYRWDLKEKVKNLQQECQSLELRMLELSALIKAAEVTIQNQSQS